MAMYYQSSTEIEGDGLHNLYYMMNPNYIHTQSQSQSNMLLSNPAVPNSQTPRGLSLSLAAHHKQQTGFGAGQSMITGSKYLWAAQDLLDEVVSVGNHKGKLIKGGAVNKEAPSADKADLTTAERQEIQIKKAKLHSMLDEVEQRCRHYDHQMQTMIAAFEQAAGAGSARSYTRVALKTILKQFRCLKSTISAEMKGLNKRLGQEAGSELSRLRFVDRQQVGNAWRSQRGLPERAVSQLRAWLFQHFLHPYPKNSDKQILAKQTGLTRSQVSNWFINARVRLWKPMVEEMYLQETTGGAAEEISVSPPPSLPANCLPMGGSEIENINTYGKWNGIEQQGDININGFSLSLGIPPAHTFQVEEMMDFHNRKHLLPA